jgi:glycyl-tRNA synthetase
MEKEQITIEELANFCKRKGLVFRSSDIYGGFAGFWDFGPLGVELFNNIKESWWNFFVHQKENMAGIEASIISHPNTWKASGHTANFNDISVPCRKCRKYSKVDKQDLGKAKCSFCEGELDSSKGKELNLMFKTQVGPVSDESQEAYLRPETAQGMFLDFKQVAETARMQLPFGIAQIGRCFRNEIAPRDFLFRSREFNIAEFEFFINPEDEKCEFLEKRHLDLKLRLVDGETQEKGKEQLKETTIGKMLNEKRLEEWHAYWLAEQLIWYAEIGLSGDKIKVREHMKSELSHYSKATFDIDFEFPFGSKELGGNANRGQYDLNQHKKFGGQKLEIFDEKYKKSVMPKVIEPTFGIERAFLAVLTDAYEYDKKRDNVVLKISPKIAPYKAAILPLVKNEASLVKLSRSIFSDLRKEMRVDYDDSGSVGRRYSRNDECGTPFCITIDNESIKDKSVTIRNRDDAEQVRVKTSDLKEILKKLINREIEFSKAGKKINTRVKE